MRKAKNPEQIAEFIKKAFALYDLSYETFFREYNDEEGKYFELPIILGNKLAMPIVERAAMCLGLSVENLLSMDDGAIRRRYIQYPYFGRVKEFQRAYHESYFREPAEEFICRAIFSDEEHLKRETRFDYNDVKGRLLSLIDTYSEDFPGLKHNGKTISYLDIKTETVFQYEYLGELITAYLDMFQRFKSLFFKAWESELSSDEVLAYNFLVSCLGIRDIAYTIDAPLYYDLLKAFVPIYKSEDYKSIFSYIKVNKGSVPPFWKCANIVDHLDLTKQLAEIYPRIKAELRQVVMDAKNYRCAYLWSDEEKPSYTPEYELYVLGLLHDFGDESAGDIYHYLYVPKTERELGETAPKIEQFSILSGPETLGGLPMLQIELKTSFSEKVKRMQARAAAAPKMKWGVDLYE